MFELYNAVLPKASKQTNVHINKQSNPFSTYVYVDKATAI